MHFLKKIKFACVSVQLLHSYAWIIWLQSAFETLWCCNDGLIKGGSYATDKM